MENVYSSDETEFMLGENIKAFRLQKNISRETLCEQAGISLNALRNLELGRGTTLKTLVKVVRALGKQEWLENFAPKATINPLHMVREKEGRQRASRRKRSNGKKEN